MPDPGPLPRAEGRIEWFDEIDSTNAEARRRAEAGERGPVWFAARRQTAGRGRRGRTWSTVEGNLAATLLTATDRSPAEAAGVSFVAALAVHDLASAYAGHVALKWPNDVLIAGDKLAGILVETGPGWMAVGIGVNLASAPDSVERPATALARHAAETPTPETALAQLAVAFESWRGLWESQGLPLILDAWLARAPGIPGPCAARLPSGTLVGSAEGLDSDGALRLRLSDGSLRRIAAGDVFFGEA